VADLANISHLSKVHHGLLYVLVLHQGRIFECSVWLEKKIDLTKRAYLHLSCLCGTYLIIIIQLCNDTSKETILFLYLALLVKPPS
jgi:hypothetical protein